jgi:hypothetical protein
MLDQAAASPRPLGAGRQVPNLVTAAQLASKRGDADRTSPPGRKHMPRGHIEHSHARRRYHRA